MKSADTAGVPVVRWLKYLLLLNLWQMIPALAPLPFIEHIWRQYVMTIFGYKNQVLVAKTH
jgi:hypothetical protein